MAGHEISPDRIHDENYKNRKTEFDSLSRKLAERELELATLENELRVFETRYAKTVGILLAELDELDKEIAKEMFRLNPEDKYKRGFENAQRKATSSQQAVNEKIGKDGKKVSPSSEKLRKLYLKVALTIHPDHAMSDDEIEYRTALMARANEAFANGDQEALEQILVDWDHWDKKSNPDVSPLMAFDQLEKQISRIKARLKEIEVRIGEMKKSDIYQLMLKVKRAEEQGLDLLSEMKDEIQQQIETAKSLLNDLKQQKKAE
jgi:hypothetical protein